MTPENILQPYFLMLRITSLLYVIMFVSTIAICYVIYRKQKAGTTNVHAFKRWGIGFAGAIVGYYIFSILMNTFIPSALFVSVTPIFLILWMSISMITLFWTAYRSKNRF